VFWKGPLMRFTSALDRLPGTGDALPEEARPLRVAFETLIVLVQPS